MFLLMAFPQINELWCTSARRFWTGPTLILMSQRGCLHNLCRTPLSKNQLQCPSLNSNHKSIARKMCVILLGRKQKWAYPIKFDFCQSVNGKNETEDTCMVSNFRFVGQPTPPTVHALLSSYQSLPHFVQLHRIVLSITAIAISLSFFQVLNSAQ